MSETWFESLLGFVYWPFNWFLDRGKRGQSPRVLMGSMALLSVVVWTIPLMIILGVPILVLMVVEMTAEAMR